MYLNTDSELNWSEKQPCTLSFKNKKDSIVLNGAFKLRGGMSSKYFKHSFSLELNNKYSLGGLPKDDDWILNANYIDKTFMRHKISYDLFRQMNSKNIAPESAFIQLNLNNNYEGLYVLMEEINGGMIGINNNDPAAMVFKDPPIFYPEKLEWVQDSSNYYQQKFPKIQDSDKSAFLETFMAYLYKSDSQSFAKNIHKWVDLENVIDWHLILLFSNNGDGILKNFYLYKIDSQTPLRFAIWDYDHSFGRDGDGELNMMERPLDCSKAILLKRLMENKELDYFEKIKKRYWALRDKNVFSRINFKKMVHDNDRLISKEVSKNFNRWPTDAKWYHDSNSYQEELNIMNDFVNLRLKQLDDYFKKK